MTSKPGRPNLLHRIEQLETRLTDSSGLVPHSRKWLEFWDRQVYNHMMDREHVPLTFEAVRAIMWFSDDPASLVGSITQTGEYVQSGE